MLASALTRIVVVWSVPSFRSCTAQTHELTVAPVGRAGAKSIATGNCSNGCLKKLPAMECRYCPGPAVAGPTVICGTTRIGTPRFVAGSGTARPAHAERAVDRRHRDAPRPLALAELLQHLVGRREGAAGQETERYGNEPKAGSRKHLRASSCPCARF